MYSSSVSKSFSHKNHNFLDQTPRLCMCTSACDIHAFVLLLYFPGFHCCRFAPRHHLLTQLGQTTACSVSYSSQSLLTQSPSVAATGHIETPNQNNPLTTARQVSVWLVGGDGQLVGHRRLDWLQWSICLVVGVYMSDKKWVTSHKGNNLSTLMQRRFFEEI